MTWNKNMELVRNSRTSGFLSGEFNSQQTNIKKKTVTIYNEIRNKATFGCSLSHVGSPQQEALQVFFGRFSS